MKQPRILKLASDGTGTASDGGKLGIDLSSGNQGFNDLSGDQIPTLCPHCADESVCECQACTLGRVESKVPCSECGGRAREMWKRMTAKTDCEECHGTGKCNCWTCHHDNKGDCIRCRPSTAVQLWRDLPSYRERLGPDPTKGAGTHTPTQRYLSYLPGVI